MNENFKTPKIRFKGFTEDWEQRKFDEITYLSGEKNKNNLALTSYSISNEKGFIEQDIQFENGGTMRDADKSMYIIVSPNSFAYNPARINIGSIGYYDKPEKVIVSSLYEVFSSYQDIDDRFLWHWFKSPHFPRFIEKFQEGGVRQYFYYNKLLLCDMKIPELVEQKKIGLTLDNIDNLITLHQRKYDKLVNIKKSMLEKMFPKNDSKIPEIRFKGFTEDWEQRKLDDLGDYFSTGTLGYADLKEDGKYKCVLYGDLYTKFNERIFDVKSRTNTDATKVEINDILFPTSTTVDNISLIAPSCVNQANLRVGGDLFGVRPYKNIDGNFISYCINNFMPVKYSFAKQAQGLTIVHLQYNAVKNEKLMLPSIKEQNRMSQLFINIDNLITLHQRKLDKLNNFKKSMLEKMFV